MVSLNVSTNGGRLEWLDGDNVQRSVDIPSGVADLHDFIHNHMDQAWVPFNMYEIRREEHGGLTTKTLMFAAQDVMRNVVDFQLRYFGSDGTMKDANEQPLVVLGFKSLTDASYSHLLTSAMEDYSFMIHDVPMVTHGSDMDSPSGDVHYSTGTVRMVKHSYAGK